MSKKKIEPITDLSVRDVKKPASNYLVVHDNLPLVPFCLVLYGVPSSGKGVWLVNALYSFYKNVFDEVYWFSSTVHVDNTMANNVAKDETIVKINEPDDLANIDMFIRNIIDEQKARKEAEEELPEILIVLDDCVSFANAKSILQLCTSYRHNRISVIISIQRLKSLSTVIRQCMSNIIAFGIPNSIQKKKFVEEFDSFPDIERHLEEATEKPFHYLHLDLKRMKLFHGGPSGMELKYSKL